MTKLVKKTVDIETSLAQPKQSKIEKLFNWLLSKPVFYTAFITLVGWLGRANATQSEDAWNIAFGGKMGYENENQNWLIPLILIPVYILILTVVLAVFLPLWQTFCILCLLIVLLAAPVVFIDGDMLFLIGFPVLLLPVFIAWIQYKRKKIDLILFKKRLKLWLLSFPITLFLIIITAAGWVFLKWLNVF